MRSSSSVESLSTMIFMPTRQRKDSENQRGLEINVTIEVIQEDTFNGPGDVRTCIDALREHIELFLKGYKP